MIAYTTLWLYLLTIAFPCFWHITAKLVDTGGDNLYSF